MCLQYDGFEGFFPIIVMSFPSSPDKPWSQVSSPPPGACLFYFIWRIGFDLHLISLARSLARSRFPRCVRIPGSIVVWACQYCSWFWCFFSAWAHDLKGFYMPKMRLQFMYLCFMSPCASLVCLLVLPSLRGFFVRVSMTCSLSLIFKISFASFVFLAIVCPWFCFFKIPGMA